MSLQQNDIYTENLLDNMICKICGNNLNIETINREDHYGNGYEITHEKGHKKSCKFYDIKY